MLFHGFARWAEHDARCAGFKCASIGKCLHNYRIWIYPSIFNVDAHLDACKPVMSILQVDLGPSMLEPCLENFTWADMALMNITNEISLDALEAPDNLHAVVLYGTKVFAKLPTMRWYQESFAHRAHSVIQVHFSF